VRIALFSETYLPQRNGVALILDRLVRELSRRGHEVLVAAPVSWRPKGEADLPAGVRLERVPGIPLPKYPDLTLALPGSPGALSAVREFRPDVIHLATEYSLGLTGLAAARMLDVPVVTSFHTNIPGTLPYYGFGWASEACWRYLRWFHGRAARTYCPGERNREVLLARGFRNVSLWPRGVDTERFDPRHRDAGLRRVHGPDDALHLLYVGRLTPEKDLHVLFEAYRRLTAEQYGVPVHLVVAGDGAYSPSTRARAPRNVTFAGYLEGSALSAAYSSADIFVFPSRVETLGNVVLEALASGLPVVGAAEGGTLENVHDGVNGVLCRPGDPEAFAAAIARLATDPQLRDTLSRNARAWAESRGWDAAFEPLIRGYEELASR
jgi:phosphatidylinositol alpha 1,6-mannosyltransferase